MISQDQMRQKKKKLQKNRRFEEKVFIGEIFAL